MKSFTVGLKSSTLTRLTRLARATDRSINSYLRYVVTKKETPIFHKRTSTQFTTSDDIHRNIQRLARRYGVSVADVIDAYIKNVGKPRR
jgi:predicted transcriptional regulator